MILICETTGVSDGSARWPLSWSPHARAAVTVLGLSGRWTDPWLGPAICALVSIFALYALASIDDDLAKERFSPPEPGADRLPLRAIRLIAPRATSWSGRSTPAAGTGAASRPVRVVGTRRDGGVRRCLVFRAMIANRFFSPVVRIQTERGHRVIDRGPYGIIRHPGYAGMILSMPCSGLVLGSWLGFAIAAACMRR